MRDEVPGDPTPGAVHRAVIEERVPRRRSVAALMVVGALVLVAVIAATTTVRRLGTEDGPRQLRAEAPTTGRIVERTAASDEQLVEAVARRVLDPGASAGDRATFVEPGGPDRPAAASVFESFDGLARSVGARIEDATVTVELLDDEVAVATADIPITSDLGPTARVRDLMFHRGDAGWLLTYESLCGLANLAPMVGGTTSCPGNGVVHHAPSMPDPTQLLLGEGPEAPRTTPVVLAYGSTVSARTGRWSWVVDYPDAELGGGAPSTPAELVRIDATTGEETGRVRLTGTQPELASDGHLLWVLQHPFTADDTWLDPVLTVVDPETLEVGPSTQAPDASSLQAAGGVAWLVGDDGVHRYRTDSGGQIEERLRPWSGEAIADVEPYLRSLAATPSGLWILPTTPSAGAPSAGVLVDTTTMEPVPLEVPPGTLAASGDGVWSLEASPTPVLRHLGPEGRVDATLPSPMHGGGQLWGDGSGGAWLVGDAMPIGDCCQMMDHSAIRRPLALHLAPTGAVAEAWWSTGTTPNGSEWFARHGDGLGWAGIEGLELLAP